VSHTDRTVELSFGHSACEVQVSIAYTYSKACRGARERSGLQLEPDEPASVEIDSVMLWDTITQPGVHGKSGIDIRNLLSREVLDALAADILDDEQQPRED
jgi:hypothetical protein